MSNIFLPFHGNSRPIFTTCNATRAKQISIKQHFFFCISSDPIDAIRSSVHDVKADTTKKGTFTFRIAPKDRFKNPIRVAEKDNKKLVKVSVQYSSHEKPGSLKFLQCSTALSTNTDGDAYVLSCTGAEKEHISFYPSINNVPLGGKDKYEARTTLCPGKSSCKGNNQVFLALVFRLPSDTANLCKVLYSFAILKKFNVG